MLETDWLTDRLHDAMQASGSPGMAAAVVGKDETIAASAVGVRRHRHPEPLQVTDPMHIGSCTKAMTAALVGKAHEEGIVSWETPLSATGIEVHDDYDSVTIADLCAHLGGLPALDEDEDIDLLPALPDDPREQRLALARLLLSQPAPTEVGTFNYSNAGFGIVTALVEHIAGWSWEQEMNEIFDLMPEPAGIGWPRTVWGHKLEEGDPVEVDPQGSYQLPPWIRPAGDVQASTEAMGGWLQVNIRGLDGDSSFLAPDTWRMIHTPRGGPVALGWGVQELMGRRMSVHAGSADTFMTLAVIDHGDGVGIVINANSFGTVEPIAIGLLKDAVEQLWGSST